MSRLNAQQIIGRSIAELRAVYGSTGDGGSIDTARTWIVLDGEVSFSLPQSDAPAIEASSPPPLAERILPCDWPEVVGKRITAIHRCVFEGEFDSSESIVLELENSVLLSTTSAAPHGTGMAGFNTCDASECDLSKDFAPF